jgi:hypothetical protein
MIRKNTIETTLFFKEMFRIGSLTSHRDGIRKRFVLLVSLQGVG